MESKIYRVNDVSIDHSRSSIEVFSAISGLQNSEGLYLKFSKNHIKSLAIEKHAELLLDFDLCLIDRTTHETIIQLFAIFALSKNREPVNDWKYVHIAIDFARSLIVDEIKQRGLKDKTGHTIIVPAFTITPESIDFRF